MILRQLAHALRRQDWITVAVELLLVIVGVLGALQVNNWNERRLDTEEYLAALDRLRDEIRINLETVDLVEAELEPDLAAVQALATNLESCDDSPGTLAAINDSLFQIAGTTGFLIRQAALRELTSNPVLLSQQSPALRARLAELMFYTELVLKEARFYEDIPLLRHPLDNPILKIGPRSDVQMHYFGIEFAKSYRFPELAVPVSVACKDNRLLKDIWTWERWQSNLNVISRHMRNEYALTLNTLDSAS